MINTVELTIITPCYNEALTINPFFEKISEVCLRNNIKYELIFVDDGSEDNTLQKIKVLSDKHEEIHYISFSRNFGKDYAILAGLKKAQGEYTVILDVDLQHPPELIPQMLEEIKTKDLDCIETSRIKSNKESILRSAFTKIYYKLMNTISSINIKDDVREFRLMKRNVVQAICTIEESHRFSKGIFSWVGFRTKSISYTNVERSYGESKWSFWSLCKYAFQSIISFSQAFLYIPIVFGIVTFIASLMGIFINLNNEKAFIISLTILLFSLNFIFIGILGLYIAQIHLETKGRPQYIIREEK